jgi:hypothetical protein
MTDLHQTYKADMLMKALHAFQLQLKAHDTACIAYAAKMLFEHEGEMMTAIEKARRVQGEIRMGRLKALHDLLIAPGKDNLPSLL